MSNIIAILFTFACVVSFIFGRYSTSLSPNYDKEICKIKCDSIYNLEVIDSHIIQAYYYKYDYDTSKNNSRQRK